MTLLRLVDLSQVRAPQIWQEPPEVPGLGHKLRLVPGHCDPTVNLYDWLVAFRGDTVQHVWQIAGRGPGL